MREVLDFNSGWVFHRGDIKLELPAFKAYSYDAAKTERCIIGPASRDFIAGDGSKNSSIHYKSERWERVTLPHDFIIHGEFDEKNNNALGYLPYDNAWYVKKFSLTEADKGRRITVFFEGIATNATVYVNGCLMKHNFSGYTSFEVDITDVVKYDEINSIAVYVNTENHEGWWYEGGGIYRPVKMIKTDLVSVDLWGIYAKPVKLSDSSWCVEAEVTVRNDEFKARRATLLVEILDEAGAVVKSAECRFNIADKDKRVLRLKLPIENPSLYSPDTPTRYTMRAIVRSGKCSDTDEVKFGFRTVVLDPKKGLFINGKNYKVKGLCGHADCGLMGKAVPDNIHRYKVKLMKEMGANGYRTSHYPQSEALMEELDKNGFIVMDETRWFESTDEGKAQLEMLMKRDRNRACVYFWSIGNEEPHHITEEGRRISQSLMSFAKKLDSSRFVMSAVWHSPSVATVYDELEVIGINYNWKAYEMVHEKYPDKAVFSSECCATGTTRGWYFPHDASRGYLTAYDTDTSVDWRGREFTWKYITEREWLFGGYQWIAFEHRGEAQWPRLCSQSGAIDLFMQKKDAFYQNMSHWTSEPMIHVLPHWNFEGLEGEPIKVVAYTNMPSAELLVNGKSFGKQELMKYTHAEWQVPYEKGEIEVLAYDEGGNVVARDKRVTSGKPYELKLQLDTEDISANGKDIAIFTCLVLDEDGNEVYDAAPTVSFTASGAGSVYSTGSDVCDHTSIFLPTRKMRAGRISVAVKLSDKAGVLSLTAEADGLRRGRINVDVK